MPAKCKIFTPVKLSTDDAGKESLHDIFKFVLFNPEDLNNTYCDCLPLQKIVTDEEVTSSDKKEKKSERENSGNKNICSSSNRPGRSCSKPVTRNILIERRNVSQF